MKYFIALLFSLLLFVAPITSVVAHEKHVIIDVTQLLNLNSIDFENIDLDDNLSSSFSNYTFNKSEYKFVNNSSFNNKSPPSININPKTNSKSRICYI